MSSRAGHVNRDGLSAAQGCFRGRGTDEVGPIGQPLHERAVALGAVGR